jgi:mannose-6-phosphate isomerase-like protein (cupin superfamily)
MSASAVNLREKLDGFSEQWSPKIVASYNGNDVCVVRVEGEFVWHSHPDTDDFFLVLEGELEIELRDRTVTLGPGELFVVPRGVEHRPVARKGEVKLLLIEPSGTPNTGDEATATAKIAI